MTIENQTDGDLLKNLALMLQQRDGAPVEHVQTHISHILLTPGHAYKLKRPVRLPFIDFSSVAARRHFCEEELRLNRRLAPSLYLEVLPVLGSVQAPHLGAPNEAADGAIDWVVHMHRFASGSEADALVRSGALPAAEVERFANQLAHFHAACPVAAAGSAWGSAAQVQQAVGDVFETLATLLDGADALRLQALRPVFAGLEGWWAQRQADGHVREGHGDLHLGNLVRLEGALTAFDCIEFSPALRWIDTLADAAFLTMDLHAHGRSDLAWRFLDAYLSETGDYAALAVLRPYEIYRALVRALAARLRTEQGGAQACGPDYLACAEALARPMQPRLLITHGLSGSGKSTVAAALLAQAGAQEKCATASRHCGRKSGVHNCLGVAIGIRLRHAKRHVEHGLLAVIEGAFPARRFRLAEPQFGAVMVKLALHRQRRRGKNPGTGMAAHLFSENLGNIKRR